MVQGKQTPNIVLVKRSSLQQHRPFQGAAAAAGDVAGKKLTTVFTKPASSKASPLSAKTAAFTPSTSTGAASQQQLPVLAFGAPVNSSPIARAPSFEPTMHGNEARLLSSTGARRSPVSTTMADFEKETREREISSFVLAQARANWSPSANSAEVAAAAYAAAKSAAATASGGYDEIGYIDAWASMSQHFSNSSSSASHATPTTGAGAGLPLSPSFGRATATGFGALSPSDPFDARLPTVLSAETSLGLSLLPADTSLSGGLSGRTTSSLPSGTGELLASLQQIWEVPPSAEGSLTPSYCSQNTTTQATPFSADGASAGAASPLGEMLPSAELARLASLSSASGQDQAPQWLGIDTNANTIAIEAEFCHRSPSSNLASSSSLSFRGNHGAHSGSLADLGFEESSEV
jgi:hypothetical protein